MPRLVADEARRLIAGALLASMTITCRSAASAQSFRRALYRARAERKDAAHLSIVVSGARITILNRDSLPVIDVKPLEIHNDDGTETC